jgi:hypothetical protein
VAVRLDEAGHQGGAGAVDDARAVPRQAAAALHRGDALALDEHVAREGRGPAAVQDGGAGDERPGHGQPSAPRR